MAPDPRNVVSSGADAPVDPDNAAKALAADLTERGLAGTRIYAGFISEEPLPQLQGFRAFQTYQRMRLDPNGSALHKVMDLPIRSARWYVEPASDDPGDIQKADFIHDQLWEFGSQTFDDVLRLALQSLIFGFSWLEIVYALIQEGPWKGMVGWDSFAWRSQASKWKWNVEEVAGRRQLTSITQLAAPYYRMKDIQRSKVLLFVNEQEGENFDGWSYFRPAYPPWFYMDQLKRIEAIGLERAFMGIPKAKLRTGYSPGERALAKQVVTSVRTDEQAGILYTDNMEIDVLFNRLNGQPMDAAISRHRAEFFSSGLADLVLLGQKESGSFALSSDKQELLMYGLNATANRHEEVFNLDPGIPTLIRFNFPDYDPQRLPKLVHGDIGSRNLDRIGRTLSALAQFGFLTPDDATEDKFRQLLDLPEREENLANRDLADLIQQTFPTAPDWQTRGPESVRLRPNTLAVPPGALGSGQRSPVGQSPAGTESVGQVAPEAQFAEWREQLYYLFAQRKPWDRPAGRVTSETRRRARATEMFGELLDEMTSHAGQKPLRPSVRWMRERRPYEIQLGERSGRRLRLAEEAAAAATVKRVMEQAKAGTLQPNPDRPTGARTVIPRQLALAHRARPKLRDALSAKARESHQTRQR